MSLKNARNLKLYALEAVSQSAFVAKKQDLPACRQAGGETRNEERAYQSVRRYVSDE